MDEVLGCLGCFGAILLILGGLLVVFAPGLLLAFAALGLLIALARRLWAWRTRGSRGPEPTDGAAKRAGRRWPAWLVAGALGLVLLLPPIYQPVHALGATIGRWGLCGDPDVLAEAPSPGGRYAAEALVWFCGGAAGSLDTEVNVRHQWDALAFYAETVLSIDGRAQVRLSWQDEATLVVHYDARGGRVLKQLPTWDGVTVIYGSLNQP